MKTTVAVALIAVLAVVAAGVFAVNAVTASGPLATRNAAATGVTGTGNATAGHTCDRTNTTASASGFVYAGYGPRRPAPSPIRTGASTPAPFFSIVGKVLLAQASCRRRSRGQVRKGPVVAR